MSQFPHRRHELRDTADALGIERCLLHAYTAGKVIEAKWGDRQGWGVSIDMGGGYKTYYFHMTAEPKVKDGQRVKQGQLLGYVGDTGQAKGNPHLHYTVTKDDKGIKPVFNGKTQCRSVRWFRLVGGGVGSCWAG
ncbi:M23 family metallopeptidase [Actinokineospora auranticolor]|uniref:Peptidase M23-like protein n=1 Tax=Actinokineospora auranticolor TaxID=155976 RepID=A0A2S6GBX9_9PSEU|nr:peptidase M23-like protein [Actinokineospora auranticolor]